MTGRPRVYPQRTHQSAFGRFARRIAAGAGHPRSFALALAAVVGWALSGPLFGWSDTWQLVINTSTTILTFLMVFLIQNTANRDASAMHLKLDELIRADHYAHNALLDLEQLSEDELHTLLADFAALAAVARDALEDGHR